MTSPPDLARLSSRLVESDTAARRLLVMDKDGFKKNKLSETERLFCAAAGFKGKAGQILMLPTPDGKPGLVLAGVGSAKPDLWDWSAIAAKLPGGVYRLDIPAFHPTHAALGWALGGYCFERYREKSNDVLVRLVWPDGADRASVTATLTAITLVRDLVNTPTSDMGPQELAIAADQLASKYKARIRHVVGDDLIKQNYPLIHAVGRAATDGRSEDPRAPRLIDLMWGDEKAPKVTLVGKGVCFDTGGLDLKPASNMKLMKKDMGGAAHALALAGMIMEAKLPVRLRVLVPAVENSVSGNAFRPMDIVPSRAGLSVEIGNTDAEGRLILADALAEAVTEKPDLLIDFATLTGAARVALGPDLPALFSNNDAFVTELLHHSQEEMDPLWRMPLWEGYTKMLESKIADVNSAPDNGFAGAITAALFLQKFVKPEVPWAHIDLFAWNASDKPGRPQGGEAFTIRAIFSLLRARYGSNNQSTRSAS